jgi:hypothetical protein
MTTTTRRAALGALAAVPAALALPAVAATAPEGIMRFFRPGALERGLKTLAQGVPDPALDAELFRLIDVAREAGARYRVATNALEQIWQRREEVPRPTVLIATEDDTRLWKMKAGEPFSDDRLIRFKEAVKHRRGAQGKWSLIAADPIFAEMDEKVRAMIQTVGPARGEGG